MKEKKKFEFSGLLGWLSLSIDLDNIGTFYLCVPFLWSLIQIGFRCLPGQQVANTSRCPRQRVVTLLAAPDNRW